MGSSPEIQLQTLGGFLFHRRGALVVTLAYALLAGGYIFFSSWLAHTLAGGDIGWALRLEILKGWGYVLLTGAALYGLLRYGARVRQREEEAVSQLIAAHQRLKLLVEGNPHFFFYTQDQEGRVTYVSPSVKEITGRDVEEWIGQHHWWVTENPINEEARRKTAEHLAGHFDGKPVLVEMAHPSGRRVLVEAFEAPLLAEGKQVGIQGVAHDVTAERRAQLVKDFSLSVSFMAGEAKSVEELFSGVHRELGKLFPVPNFFVGLGKKGSWVLEFPFFVDQEGNLERKRAVIFGLAWRLINLAKPFILTPNQEHPLPTVDDLMLIGPPHWCWMGAPLVVEGQALGGLLVQSHAEQLRYTEEDLELLTLAAGQVAQVLRRFQLAQELAETAERFRALVELSPDAILIHQDGVIKFANPAAARLWGCERPGDLLGKQALDLVAPSFRGVVAERIRRGLEEGVPEPPLVEEFLRLDGSTFRGEASAVPISYEGRPALEVVIRDVSERERAEALLREGQKMEAIGSLAGGIAHDFSNLLQAMTAILYSLRESCSDRGDVPPRLHTLEELVERGASLVRQLLLFARRGISRRELVDLNGLVASWQGTLRRLLPENVTLEVRLAPHEVLVEADPSQLQQVLMNLVLNARDAMPQGGTLRLATEERGTEVALVVSDTGHGIPDSVRHRIFEPFFTTKGGEGGTGLGLAVVHGIVT
ncbi:MAG: PAS domain S-box protein, partial [Thermoanaerobaculum sp.]|nr:PAS domain S-box protein [Thermoanaerobaculum sp.]MDW7968225.1 PAS domain S-box protein [Thermoanaerobaculum sp.]